MTIIEKKSAACYDLGVRRRTAPCCRKEAKPMFCIITNNPKCYEKYNAEMRVDYLPDGGYLDVLLRARSYVNDRQYCLVTHPLAGSIKPNQIPYRSIIVKDTRYDDGEYFDSCIMIESSIGTYHRIMAGRPLPVWPERLLDDFQDADLSLFDGAFGSMNQ